ncbi:MAG: potassium transporter [Legionellales bacterium]|nr:potassium transporter [Legionellales bacterium]
MQLHILESIILLLTSAVVVSTIFRRFNLPPVLGYLVVGACVGPYGLGWMPDIQATSELAEFGVVFLMFTIGLEFSLAKLIAMKRLVLGLGGLQVAITTAITMLVAFIAHAHIAMALVVGGVAAMSSTAIVSKQLNDQLELNTPQGLNAIGILLFQDIAVIPFLILIPSLASGNHNVLVPLIHAVVKAAIVMILIMWLGRKVLRPIFHVIAATRSMEIFTLTVLLVTLSSAWLTDKMGLSSALGAFLAGMMLGETEFRHQIEVEIRPFRDVLLGLFFITIGMLLNLSAIPDAWRGILILLTLLIFFKTFIIFGLCRIMGDTSSTALRTGLILAQGGEFSFALLTVAMDEKIFQPHYNQMVLCALLFSMALSPFLIRYNNTISQWFLPKKAHAYENEIALAEAVAETAEGMKDHVIICGYGRVGQNICHFLEAEGFQFLALDMDPSRVQKAKMAGESVTYGDAGNMGILKAAGIMKAKTIIFSFEEPHTAIKAVYQVRQEFPDLPILVRTRDDTHLAALQEAGATEVIPEILEASLMISFHVLVLMGVPVFRAIRHLRSTRADRYQLLHRIYPSEDMMDVEDIEASTHEQLHVVKLTPRSFAIGKKLKDLNIEATSALITSIKRNGIRVPEPDPETEIRADDVVVLYGVPESLDEAERLLLDGEK